MSVVRIPRDTWTELHAVAEEVRVTVDAACIFMESDAKPTTVGGASRRRGDDFVTTLTGSEKLWAYCSGSDATAHIKAA